MMLEAALVTGLYVTAVLAAQSPTVEVEFDRERDFSQYRTYSWSDSQQPAADLADHVRITKAIAGELEDIGMIPDTSSPDVSIRYRLQTETKKIHVRSRQKKSTWDPTDVETTVGLGDHKEALLIVEMLDEKSGALLWRAQCSHPKPSSDVQARSIQETVERLFERYPTRSK